ncbi:AMP-binding protein [Planosporangium sp. 12N6]|uniref:AMP-binding protein n=1 Tax=Planosporangium spinosum TaxID=3402278 RepID=UPI003CE75779
MGADLVFATSGTTGEPVRWLRTAAQVRAEAELLAVLCDAGDADGIVCYPPPAHLYGHLMGRALPDLLGLPVRRVGLTEPARDAFAGLRRPVVAALPAALAHLSRALPLLRRLDRLTLVHSSALLPAAATRLLADLDGRAGLVELFGSTETGLVATRRDPLRPEWTLAPDVAFDADVPAGGEAPLRVRSPRLATRPGTAPATRYTLDDLVDVVDARTFRWLGRRSRLVKVNGRRVNLDLVTDTLRGEVGADAVPEHVVTCRPHRDDLRGEWFSVRVASGDPAVLAAVTAACRRLPAWQQPRSIEPVPERITT